VRNTALGERDLMVSAAPLKDSQGRTTSAVVVMQDVTGMRQMDRRKDEFIATAAHEIRNPLAALSGYQQLLRRAIGQIEAPPRATDHVEAIGKQIKRLDNLVERLLDAQRIELGKLVLDREVISLRDVVRSKGRVGRHET
jgi:signal transduction histidine kinase